MKKIISLALLICLFNATNAQIKGNDIYTAPTQVDGTDRLPDLVITRVKVSGNTVSNNGPIRTITFEIKNQGNNSLGRSAVTINGYFTNDDVYDAKTMKASCGTVLRNVNITLSPGKTITTSYNCEDKGIFSKYRYFVIWADVNNSITEKNENNNLNTALIN